MSKSLEIGHHEIGPKKPCYIIAEMSANHLMDEERAHRIVEAAAEAGANALKLQTYTPDTITLNCDDRPFQITQGTIWDGTTLYALYEEAYTPWEWQASLKKHAEDLGMDCFSSPFDPTSVSFLEELGVEAYKVASFEITDIPLIRMIAKTGKPMIFSTGIARLEDIERALHACREMGNDSIALLKCVSAYPAPFDGMNLKTIPNMAETFNVVPGLSDHSLGNEIAVASVALGARIIEKHLTLRRSDGGPDAAFSMEPEEFKAMVDAVRNVEAALGHVSYDLSSKQVKSREHSRSLFVCAPVKAGEQLTVDNIRSVRPAFGLHTKHYEDVLGSKASRDLHFGEPLSWDMISIGESE